MLVAGQEMPTNQETPEAGHRLLWFQNRNYVSLNRLTCNLDIFLSDVDIDFGTHAEFAFQVNAGLDREGDAWDKAARVARFEVIDVDTVAVHFFTDRVSGPVGELFAVAGALDDAARDVVDLRSAN